MIAMIEGITETIVTMTTEEKTTDITMKINTEITEIIGIMATDTIEGITLVIVTTTGDQEKNIGDQDKEIEMTDI